MWTRQGFLGLERQGFLEPTQIVCPVVTGTSHWLDGGDEHLKYVY